MKLVITIMLLLIYNIHYGQSTTDTLISYGEKRYEEIENIKREYDRLQINSDFFIYRENFRNAYGYYLRKIYDSLSRNAKQNDFNILENSILKLKYRDHMYVKFQPELLRDLFELIKYDKNNRLLEIITYSYKPKTFRIDNLINKTSFTYSNDNLSYTFSKYKSINENNEFSNLIYLKTGDRDGKVVERNYEKDFPISKEEIIKQLPAKFIKQAPKLMKGKKYSYDWKDWRQGLTKKSAKLESEAFKLLIHKDKVELKQQYNENSIPFYEATIIGAGYHRKLWLLKINPKTGDIYQIELHGSTE